MAGGDEVLVPALTFVASPNAISYCGAIPHFVDSDTETLGVNAAKLRDYLKETAEVRGGKCWNRRTSRVIRALVVVHTFGHPADLDAIAEVCERYRIELVEDAADDASEPSAIRPPSVALDAFTTKFVSFFPDAHI